MWQELFNRLQIYGPLGAALMGFPWNVMSGPVSLIPSPYREVVQGMQMGGLGGIAASLIPYFLRR